MYAVVATGTGSLGLAAVVAGSCGHAGDLGPPQLLLRG